MSTPSLRSRFAATAALLGAILVPLSAAAQPSPQPVFELVDARLRQMREVALYKTQHGLAVADVAREAVVLESAEEAAAAVGLDPLSVSSFYRLQIQAAKAIQYRYLADWALGSDAGNEPAEDLETQIRPRLIRLGRELTAALHGFLAAGGCFGPEHLPRFVDTVGTEHLTEAEEILLFESMSQIDLAPPRDHCPDAGAESHARAQQDPAP